MGKRSPLYYMAVACNGGLAAGLVYDFQNQHKLRLARGEWQPLQAATRIVNLLNPYQPELGTEDLAQYDGVDGRKEMSAQGTPDRRSRVSNDASGMLRQALEGHYSGWQQKQELKVRRFVEETLDRGLTNLHDPMLWGHNSMKFLTSDDPHPKWMSDAEALDMLYGIAEQMLADMGIDRYHLDHGVRDFAGGKSFTFFRLCNDAETSLQNWITEQTVKTIECVEEAVKVMTKAAANGDADVWAKLPSGRFSNYLLKDEPLPVGLTRDQAVNEITKIVLNVLDKEFDLPGVEVATMGSMMSGTYFKLTYRIPLPASSPTQSRRTPPSSVRSPPSAYKSPGSARRAMH